MPEKERKILDLTAIFSDLTPKTALEILEDLLKMDMSLWMTLAEDFPHPPVALVKLVTKAGTGFPEGVAVPTTQEQILFLAGALPPSRRVVEIALYIANDPETLHQFEKLVAPIVARREQVVVESLAAEYGAKQRKVLM